MRCNDLNQKGIIMRILIWTLSTLLFTGALALMLKEMKQSIAEHHDLFTD